MPAWPTKDPETVADYRYDVPLDEGDSVTAATITKLSGSVSLDTQSADLPSATITAWLSGGTDGETTVFRVNWSTAGGRDFDDIITLPVAANEITALALTGYAKPSPAHLIARYPAFASVPLATIRAWLTDAERFVNTSWMEGDYAAALMALAAHNMALGGIGSETAQLPAGVTRFKSGAMDVTISDAAANAQTEGDYCSTRYGHEFARLLRRNFAGPRVIRAIGCEVCA